MTGEIRNENEMFRLGGNALVCTRAKPVPCRLYLNRTRRTERDYNTKSGPKKALVSEHMVKQGGHLLALHKQKNKRN